MPQRAPSPRVPKYCHHKATDRAFVKLDGHFHYLGNYGSPESRTAYERLIATWLTHGRTLHREDVRREEMTVEELLAAYWRHAQSHYRDRETGEESSELGNMKTAMGFVRRLYADQPVGEFGPLALKNCREAMVQHGHVRRSCNQHTNRIRRVFRWGVENELVAPSVYQALQAVQGLRRGRCEAEEGRKVEPVPVLHVEATAKFVTEPVRIAIRLQLLTGARPGEVLSIRGADIDQEGRECQGVKVWLWRPHTHKTAWRGHDRVIVLGPQAQELLQPLLERKPPDQPLLDPRDAVAKQMSERSANRQTPRWPSHVAAQARKRSSTPDRQLRESYTTASYRHAIVRAAKRAGVPQWHPHQLRHTFATEYRRQFGADRAQQALGHASMDATAIYADRSIEQMAEVAARFG